MRVGAPRRRPANVKAERPDREGYRDRFAAQAQGSPDGRRAQTVADVVAGNDEVAAIVALAPHEDMDVRVVRIPMIDPNPIEPDAEIPHGLRHQVPCDAPRSKSCSASCGDTTSQKMMPVGFAAVGKGAMVRMIVLGIKHPTRSAVLRYAFPPHIGQAGAERRSPRRCRATRALTANTVRSFVISRAAARCRQRDERLGVMRAARPCPRRAQAERGDLSSRIMARRARGARSREIARSCKNWQAVVRSRTSCKVPDVSAFFRHPTEPQPAAFFLPSRGRV